MRNTTKITDLLPPPDKRKEELPKMENHWIRDPEVVDTSSQDNNLTDIQKRTQNMLDNRPEELPKMENHVEPKRPVVQLRNLVKKAQDKGIIQLGFVAVVIAGTIGAHVWGKN
jgi:hypothetical protein